MSAVERVRLAVRRLRKTEEHPVDGLAADIDGSPAKARNIWFAATNLGSEVTGGH